MRRLIQFGVLAAFLLLTGDVSAQLTCVGSGCSGTPVGNIAFPGDVTVAGDLTPTGALIVPMGEISYFAVAGTTVTIAAQSDGSTNMVVVPVVTALNAESQSFDNGGANNGRLRYTGVTTRMFHIALSWSAQAATPADVFVLGVAKNGTPVAASKVINTINGTQIQGSAIHVYFSMVTNDYIELYVGNTTAGRDIKVMTLNLFAMGM